MVSVSAEPHNGYVTERMRSSEEKCQGFAPGAWRTCFHLNGRLRQEAPRRFLNLQVRGNLCIVKSSDPNTRIELKLNISISEFRDYAFICNKRNFVQSHVQETGVHLVGCVSLCELNSSIRLLYCIAIIEFNHLELRVFAAMVAQVWTYIVISLVSHL